MNTIKCRIQFEFLLNISVNFLASRHQADCSEIDIKSDSEYGTALTFTSFLAHCPWVLTALLHQKAPFGSLLTVCSSVHTVEASIVEKLQKWKLRLSKLQASTDQSFSIYRVDLPLCTSSVNTSTSVTYFTWLCKLPLQCLCDSITQSVILIIIVVVVVVVVVVIVLIVIIIILSVVGSWNTFVRWCAVGHWMCRTCISSCGRWMSVCTCLLRTCGHKSSVKHASQLR